MHIGLVHPSNVAAAWPVAQKHLQLAMPFSGGRCELQDVYAQVLSGEQNLWLVADGPEEVIAAFTTRVSIYPSTKMLVCQFCGGSRMSEWISLADDILVRFGRDAGCSALEMTGRPGWQRKLPIEWETEAILYRREIPNANSDHQEPDEQPP